MDQAVKYIEDLQDDFDFRYKTLQSRGEPCYKVNTQVAHFRIKKCDFLVACNAQEYALNYVFVVFCVSVLDSTDKNSEMMKQEVTRLQEMLNRLDFKRKVIWFLSKYLSKSRKSIKTHKLCTNAQIIKLTATHHSCFSHLC